MSTVHQSILNVSLSVSLRLSETELVEQQEENRSNLSLVTMLVLCVLPFAIASGKLTGNAMPTNKKRIEKDTTIEQLLPIFLSLLKDEFPDVCLNISANLIKSIRSWSKAKHRCGSKSLSVRVAAENEEHSCKGPSENQIKLYSDQVKADCYGKFQAKESDEAARRPSNSDLHEWGQSNHMDTIPKAGSSSSQAFSS
ncbi:hypothetical protein RHMOL_Rhmol08G0180700 [Rhododendron molle]|uniref:Uncharacterized protein n=1 Tax=Rhododendron molle TaxID=49168 RepID=A0ACC0MQB1_RHOML|nr:hypothetical protein RHMOL_Rhmol08G0180700 [Rhododendron molle]